MALEIGLLGSIEASVDGAPLALGGPRQRRLLAHLALAPGRVRSTDSTAAAVWPDGDLPADPRQAIRNCVFRLRGALGVDVVVARDGGYVLMVSPSVVDAGRFEMLVREAADPGCSRERAVDLLTEALNLWRGNALDGFETEEWATADAVRLEELRARAADDRAEVLLALGRPADAVADLEAAVVVSPLREHTHALLMSALHRSGRQAEALRVYQRYRRRLATDLGLAPGAELQRVEADIALGVPAGAVETSGRPLRGYLLGERIGDGSFAVVYKATQPSVDRDVAVKVIRAELANRPEFIRRFEAEAHMVAHLEHPHIVPLYDYWREPGGAFLVMRLLRGGTLDDRIGSGRLDVEDAVRLAQHVGSALSAAHRERIVHRDVKPANVFLDGDGNFFLGDFGIALEAAAPVRATDTLSVGSPAYASPEQLRRQAVGPPADVHGLAITLFEALTAQLPFPEARSQAELLQHQLHDALPSVCTIRPDLPRGLDAVLARAAAKDPSARYATVDEFVASFTATAHGAVPVAHVGRATVTGELRNPYKGLRAFQEADAADFRGRQRLVDKLVTTLSGTQLTSRFMTVVGPSGSGKSSVVRAGLLPAIRSGALPGSAEWFVTSMIPGSHPFEELESALNRIAIAPTAGLAELMASDRRGIARAVKQACPVEGAEVVVLVDQFEELFTMCPDDLARRKFIAGLVEAVSDPRSRLRVVATLRADFYDRPLRYPELAPFIEEGAVTVSPLAPDELERAITEPAQRVGAAFEPGLVAQVVADVLDQPGALPLLQYVLTELFDANVSGLMTLSSYEALGGLSGALARRAEQLYEQARADEQEAARRIFTRLVTLGEGTEDTRRRVRRSELPGADGPVVDRVIGTYGAARLLAFDRDPVSREPTVEVAHEALIREWPRLRSWLDDDRDGLRVHRHLTEAAASWDTSGRDPGELYRGGRLEAAAGYAREHPSDLNARESGFVDASTAASELERRRQARENRRLRGLLAGVGTLLVIALTVGVLALSAQRRASRGERDAARQALVSNAVALRGDKRELAALLAIEAHRLEPSAATESALFGTFTSALGLERTITPDVPFEEGVLMLDNETMAIENRTGTVHIVDVDTGHSNATLQLLDDPNGHFMWMDATPDARYLATGWAVDDVHGHGVFSVWDLPTRQRRFANVEVPFNIGSVAINDDASRVAIAGGPDGRTMIYDGVTGALVHEVEALPRPADASLQVNTVAVVFAPGGELIVGSQAGPVRFVDASTGRETRRIAGEQETSEVSLWLSADGESLVTLGWQGAMRYDLRSGAPLWPRAGLPADCESFSYAERDRVLLCTSRGGRFSALDVETGAITIPPFDPQQGTLCAMPYTPDGSMVVATPCFGGSYTIWRVGGDGPVSRVVVPFAEEQHLLEYVAGGRFLLAESFSEAGPDESVLIDTLAGTTERLAGLHVPLPTDDPDTVTVMLDDTTLGRYDLAQRQRVGPSVNVGFPVRGVWTAGGRTAIRGEAEPDDFDSSRLVIVDADGRTLADVERAGDLVVFDAEHLVTIDCPRAPVIVTCGLQRRDPSTAAPVGERVTGDGGYVKAAGVAGVVVAADAEGQLHVLDGETLEPVGAQLPRIDGFAASLAISADGRRLLVVGEDAQLHVYDVPSRIQLGDAIPLGRANGGVLRADGLQATVVTRDGIVVWDLDPAHWVAAACAVAGRNLTRAEWNEYIGDLASYRATCPEFPTDE